MSAKLTLPLFFVLVVHTSSIVAQLLPACPPGTPGNSNCASTCAMCTMGTIQGSTADNVLLGPAPVFCGTVNNPEWYAFVAGATSGTFLLTASDCDLGFGLEIALYDDCNSAPLACLSGGGQSLALPVSDLKPGETYFLMVDGQEGDGCNYTLQASDPALTTAPAVGGNQVSINGLGTTCPGATTEYCLSQPVANASHYTWQAPFGSLINGQEGPLTLPAASGTCVTVTFGVANGQIRVVPMNSCGTGTPITRNVQVPPLIVMQLPTLYLNEDSLPYNWQNVYPITLKTDSIYHFVTVFSSSLGCDSMVRQSVVVYKPNTAYGLVYWDVNDNGTYDGALDKPYAWGAILESASGQFGTSAPNGRYKLSGLNDLDTVRVAPIPGLTITPDFQPYDKNQTPWANRNFGLYPPPTGYDLNAFTNATGVVRPGFNSIVVVRSKNTGLTAASAVTLQLVLPPILTYQSASVMPFINGDTLIWNVSSIAPGDEINFYVNVQCDLVPIGTPYQLVAIATGAPAPGDLYPGNNTYIRQGAVVGSYDPNDKQVAPQYLTPDQLATGDRQVEYTIRFQNTGNYPAEFVRIIDTLGPGLDPAGFRFLASSHPCTWTLSGNGVVEFFFKNINLPDSVSNEPESHGFVTFTVRLKSSLQLGDMAENFADIYFDFNPPIRTNTAGTQIVYFLPGDPPGGAAMSARPNPASYIVHFAWLTPLREPGILRLFTATGVPAAEMPVAAGLTGADLYVADQPPGVYVAVLDDDGKRYVKTVVIHRQAEQPIRRPGKN